MSSLSWKELRCEVETMEQIFLENDKMFVVKCLKAQSSATVELQHIRVLSLFTTKKFRHFEILN